MRGSDGFLELTNQLFDSINLDEVQIVPPANGPAGTGKQSITLAEWLQDLVRQAASVNLAAVGWVGVALICYAALGLMMTIENCFNTIYRAPQSRAWTRQVPLYWFILTMSPVAIGVMVYVNSFVANSIGSVPAGQTLLSLAGALWNLVMGWLILFAIYALLPNAKVALQSAAAGAVVSALLLEFGKQFLGAYLNNAFAVSQLYGSLGLIPLFMFWVYLMWLAVLFGLEVSATLQALHGRDLEAMESKRLTTGLLDPVAIIPVMEVVAQRFADGHTTTARYVAEEYSLPQAVVELMFARLIQRRLLHSVDGNTACVSLARPAEQISVQELIDVGYELVDEPVRGRQSGFVARFRKAQHQLAGQTSLATIGSGDT